MFNSKMYLLLIALPLVIFMAGCGGNGDDEDTGTLSVSLTDDIGPYDNVVLSIKAIYAVQAGHGDDPTSSSLPLIKTFSPSHVVDVLTLQFIQHTLGSASVPAGSYEQIRLVLDPNPTTGDPVNYVTLPGSSVKIPLNTPSGHTSGLKILGRFTVLPGEMTALAIDFDPSRAIVTAGASGNYILKPTGIRLVEMADLLPTYGTLSGFVAPELAWPSAVVSIVPEGASTAIASGLVNPDDGFFRAFVPTGSYAVRVNAIGYDTYDSADLLIPIYHDVILGADTMIDTITLSPTP